MVQGSTGGFCWEQQLPSESEKDRVLAVDRTANYRC